jgi:hypothetical protein
MNKYAEQMEKVALNRLTREIAARPLAFSEKRMQRLLGSGREGTLDAVSRRQGPDPRQMLRSPDSIAVGQEYGTRQMLAKRVSGPDAPFTPGTYVGHGGPGSRRVDEYIRGPNSHGQQWDAEEYRSLWNNQAEDSPAKNAPKAEDTRGLKEKLKDKWEAFQGRETSLEKQLPNISSARKPVLHVNRQPTRIGSNMGFGLNPVVQDGGLHLYPEVKLNIPHEGIHGYAGMERSVAARHEMFEADTWSRRIADSTGGRLGDITRHPNHFGGLGHAGAEVLINEAKMQAKNPWQGILPPSTLESSLEDGGFASTPISGLRRARNEDVLAMAAARLKGKDRSVANVAREAGIPVYRIHDRGLGAADRIRKAVNTASEKADFAIARGRDAFEGSLRYRTPTLVDDFKRQSTYKDSMK